MLKKVFPKISILFVLNNLDGSGIKTSFLNLLSYLDVLDYEVDVLIFKDDFNSKKILKSFRVNILSSNLILRAISFNFSEFKFDFFNSISFIILKILFAIFNKKFIFVLLLNLLKIKFEKKYDYSVSFINDIWKNDKIAHYNGANDFILRSTRSNYKISWIHNDPIKLGFTKKIVKQEYIDFSHIINVSRYCEKVFLSFNVISKRKSFVLNNFLNQAFKPPLIYKKLNPLKVDFISSSRIEIKQKRIDRIVSVSRMLVENGFRNFNWIIIGSGKMIEEFRKDVIFFNLDKNVHFIGKVSNPFDYYMSSDFFVQTSDYEAHSLALLEAKFSRLSLIVMNYNGASEVVTKKEGFLINFSENDLYNKLANILKKPHYFRKFFFRSDYNKIKLKNINDIKHLFK